MVNALTQPELEAAHRWEPEDRVPGRPGMTEFRRRVRIHQARWREAARLNSLRALDVAFVLDLGDGTRGVVGVDTKYHEWLKPETPKPGNLWRYLEVAERSGGFAEGAVDAVKGRSGLAEMWLEHLLLLSMPQHESGAWGWGRFVVVHPAGNSDIAGGCARYRDLLVDQSTFSSVTLEELLDAKVLPGRTTAALRSWYLPS
jgi:hypothetical protein